MYHDISIIREGGYKGFLPVNKLWEDYSVLPKNKGVYLVLTPNYDKKLFLANGSGGFFKDRNPNVSIEVLRNNWVDKSHLIYIGQAGGNGSSATLNSRLRQYLEFGKGKPVGHYGGRYIWQLANHPDLIICWKETPSLNPRQIEKELLEKFVETFGRLPFANLKF